MFHTDKGGKKGNLRLYLQEIKPMSPVVRAGPPGKIKITMKMKQQSESGTLCK